MSTPPDAEILKPELPLNPRTPKLLSCWKEIAAYLGRGVRTVQRYERQHALPVRRPVPDKKRIVLAIPAELAAWAHERQIAVGSGASQTSGAAGTGARVARIRCSRAQLAASRARLQRELDTLRSNQITMAAMLNPPGQRQTGKAQILSNDRNRSRATARR